MHDEQNRVLDPAERARFLAALREDAEFRQAVRRELLTDELLELPEAFARFVHAVGERFGRVEADLAVLKEDVRVLKEDVAVLKEDVAVLKGDSLHSAFSRNPGHFLHSIVRGAHVVPIDDLLEQAHIGDRLDDDEYTLLSQADFYVRGRAPDDPAALLVVEVSFRAHTDDVARVARRRDALRRHGLEARPVVVATRSPAPAVSRAALAHGVTIVVGRSRFAA